jgi:Type IV secretion system pilin
MSNGETVLQNIIVEIFSPLYQFFAVLAFLYFLFGIVKFINGMDNPEEMKKGKSHMIFGTLGLFIILSAGVILKFLSNTLGAGFVF